MSEHIVAIEEILNVQPHPNADRLELATVKDWQCVVGKGTFKSGDMCIYIPIDSMLPDDVMTKLFAGAKIKPSSRVKTIKLRGAISQGIAVKPSELLADYDLDLGEEVGLMLGITKYEPPAAGFQQVNGVSGPKQVNPNFRKYTSIENAKNHTNLFTDGESIVVTEKIHGTNFRAGWVPFYANTIFKKILKFLHLTPKYEFVYGSHNVQLKGPSIYRDAVDTYLLEDILNDGEVVYGEIYGGGIQKGYNYGLGEGERKLVLFDVMIEGQYLDALAFEKWVDARHLPRVPVLYRGSFNRDYVKSLTVGASQLAPAQKVREGVVCKPMLEEHTYVGRKVLKFISDEYLLRDQTDFH